MTINEMTLEKKVDMLTDYFLKRYGFERAAIIAQKIGPGIKTMSYSDCVKVGNKWHYANLLFNGKITGEEMRKEFQQLGYE